MATVYKTDDGREFSSQSEAQRHADYLAKRDAESAAEYNAYNSARANIASGNYEAALANANAALSLNKEWRNYLNRGIAYANLGRFADALADYNTALESPRCKAFSDDRALVLNNIGVLYLKQDDDGAARTYLEKAADLGSDLALRNLAKIGIRYAPRTTPNAKRAKELRTSGMNHRVKEELDQAIADYTEAINLGYQLDEAYLFRGDFYNRSGNSEAAIADWKKAADYGSPYAFTKRLDEYGIQYELGSLDPNPGAANDASSSGASGAGAEKTKSTLTDALISIGIGVVGGFVGGAIAAFVASWFFGKASIPTELVRVAAGIIVAMWLASPAFDFRKKLPLILFIAFSALFLWRSKLPAPATTIRWIMGTEAVEPAAGQGNEGAQGNQGAYKDGKASPAAAPKPTNGAKKQRAQKKSSPGSKR